jgi:hypothetical protein
MATSSILMLSVFAALDSATSAEMMLAMVTRGTPQVVVQPTLPVCGWW